MEERQGRHAGLPLPEQQPSIIAIPRLTCSISYSILYDLKACLPLRSSANSAFNLQLKFAILETQAYIDSQINYPYDMPMSEMLKKSHLPWIPEKSKGKYARLLTDTSREAVDRCEAALKLGKAGGEKAFWALAEAVYDSDFWVRADVVRALARVEDPRAYPLLLDLLNDPDDLVRFETKDAIKQIQSRFNITQQYDLLLQVEEGSARANGPFHVTASPTDIGLHVLNRRLLQGYGIDVYMDVAGRRIGLHEGKWTFDSPDQAVVKFASLDEETGIVFYVRIECLSSNFAIEIDVEFPEAVTVGDPTCDFIFIDSIKGAPLLPNNGLQSGPTRRTLFGNEILMRKTEKSDWLSGITLDIGGSGIFRRIVVNPDVNIPLIQLTPTQPNYSLGPGRVPFLKALFIPHPSKEDFEAKRINYLQQKVVESKDLTARVIGSAFRIEKQDTNLLEGYGIFVDLIAGDTHYTSFRYPMSFEMDGENRLGMNFQLEEPKCRVGLIVELHPDGRIGIRIDKAEVTQQADWLKVGLLLKRTYTQWKMGETWQVFETDPGQVDQWILAAEGDVDLSQTIEFQGLANLGMPGLYVEIQSKESTGTRFALKSTDTTSNNARALEIFLPVSPDSGIGQAEFLLGGKP